jgi:hypothetical protein
VAVQPGSLPSLAKALEAIPVNTDLKFPKITDLKFPSLAVASGL